MGFLYEEVFKLRQIDSRVRGITFIEKGDSVCTEPADYLAYMSREQLALGDTSIVQMGKSIFGPTGEVSGHIWSREELDTLVKHWIEKGVMIPADFMRN